MLIPVIYPDDGIYENGYTYKVAIWCWSQVGSNNLNVNSTYNIDDRYYENGYIYKVAIWCWSQVGSNNLNVNSTK